MIEKQNAEKLNAVRTWVRLTAILLSDNPQDVMVNGLTRDDRRTDFIVKVNPSDAGKVIGRGGNSARAIRTLLVAISGAAHAKFTLSIEHPKGKKGIGLLDIPTVPPDALEALNQLNLLQQDQAEALVSVQA